MNKYQRIGSKNRILTPEQIQQVNESVLNVMENIGCRVDCKEAIDILSQAG